MSLNAQGKQAGQEGKAPQIRLADLGGVVKEMANVYREARKGTIDVSDATKFAYILKELRAAIEASSITDRLAAIEELIRNGGKK